ncbi:hypothetical protein EPR50_G00036790 [Perca flavescens]|uniref:Uncharacterized protein n=1 Tax=Perca flavescens TaxID=8167 RepID=A0A484DDN3_PERFV|nr:hypothetical protein EPR50_G00036790 [Perca flavescens]
MPPKKQPAIEEIDDIKRSLDFLSEEITAVRLQQKAILELVVEVQLQNQEKDKRLAFLKNRVADLEQYTRMNDVIVTGLKIKPWSYARAATVTTDHDREPGESVSDSVEQQVAAFLQSKGIKLDCNAIEACHPLPQRNRAQQSHPSSEVCPIPAFESLIELS